MTFIIDFDANFNYVIKMPDSATLKDERLVKNLASAFATTTNAAYLSHMIKVYHTVYGYTCHQTINWTDNTTRIVVHK